jgi:hypothetical protein
VNEDVFKIDDEPTHRSTDSEQNIDHTGDLEICSYDEDPAATGLLKNSSQSSLLFLAIRIEVLFDFEKRHRQVDQLRQVFQGGGLNPSFLIQRLDWCGKGDIHDETQLVQRVFYQTSEQRQTIQFGCSTQSGQQYVYWKEPVCSLATLPDYRARSRQPLR